MNINRAFEQFTFVIALAVLAAGCGSMAKSMGLVTRPELEAEVKKQVAPVELAVIAVEKALKERPTIAAMKTALETVAAGAKDGIAVLRKETGDEFVVAEKATDDKIKALGDKLGAEIATAQSAAATADEKAVAAQKAAEKAASDAGPKGLVAVKVAEVGAKADAAKLAADAAKAQAERNERAIALLAAHLRGDQKTIDKLRAELAAYFGGTGIRFMRLSGFPLDDAHGATLTATHKAAMAKAKADGFSEAVGIIGVEDGVPCRRPVTTDCLVVAMRRAKAAAAHGGFDEKLISTLSPRPEWGRDNDPSWRGVVIILQKEAVVTQAPPAAPPAPVAPPAPAAPKKPPAAAPPAITPVPPAATPPASGSPADSRSWFWPF